MTSWYSVPQLGQRAFHARRVPVTHLPAILPISVRLAAGLAFASHNLPTHRNSHSCVTSHTRAWRTHYLHGTAGTVCWWLLPRCAADAAWQQDTPRSAPAATVPPPGRAWGRCFRLWDVGTRGVRKPSGGTVWTAWTSCMHTVWCSCVPASPLSRRVRPPYASAGTAPTLLPTSPSHPAAPRPVAAPPLPDRYSQGWWYISRVPTRAVLRGAVWTDCGAFTGDTTALTTGFKVWTLLDSVARGPWDRIHAPHNPHTTLQARQDDCKRYIPLLPSSRFFTRRAGRAATRWCCTAAHRALFHLSGSPVVPSFRNKLFVSCAARRAQPRPCRHAAYAHTLTLFLLLARCLLLSSRGVPCLHLPSLFLYTSSARGADLSGT